jgi:hypothetical protein
MNHQNSSIIIQPNEIDVLCGRGGACNQHAGNQVFLYVVHHNKELYQKIPVQHKLYLAESIVRVVKGTGARFLRCKKETKTWVQLPHRDAIDKTLQALRERNPRNRANSLHCYTKSSLESILANNQWQDKQHPEQHATHLPQTEPLEPRAGFTTQSNTMYVEPDRSHVNDDNQVQVVDFSNTASSHSQQSMVCRSVTPELPGFQSYHGPKSQATLLEVVCIDESSASSKDTSSSEQFDGFDLFADWDNDDDDNVDTMDALSLLP